jgi:sec-independent protein translocase protein TatB
MGNVGGGEILVILLAALIFLGPEKLPEVARQIGKVLAEVRKVSAGFQREVQDAMRMVEDAVEAGERERPVPPPVSDPAPVAGASAVTGPPSAEPPLPEPSEAAAAAPSLGADAAHGGDR